MRYYSLCDTGKLRKVNQDNIFCSSEKIGCLPNLFVVADGMGGHNAGELASKLAIDYYIDYLKQKANEDNCDIETVLKDGISYINDLVYKESLKDENYEGMGTTFVGATFIEETGDLFVVNVGDSRLYLINDGIRKLTRDHSLVEEMLQDGELTEQEAKNHPKKNIITRAVGVEPKLSADTYKVNCQNVNWILLCSDGLTNMIEEDEMLQYITNALTLQDACNELVNEANQRGGYDNISVILMETPDKVGDKNC